MSNIGDGFKNIFLAGIGAMAYTGEKGKEIIDQLVSKGELTLDQGRERNEELQRKAGETTINLKPCDPPRGINPDAMSEREFLDHDHSQHDQTNALRPLRHILQPNTQDLGHLQSHRDSEKQRQ